MARMSIFACTAVALVAVMSLWSRAPATDAFPQGLSIAEIQAAAGPLAEASFVDRSFVFE